MSKDHCIIKYSNVIDLNYTNRLNLLLNNNATIEVPINGAVI
jgi:hypothetical protein